VEAVSALVDCVVEHVALPGEVESGDRCHVGTFKGGTLVAVVDGLGHGREAARAARAAVQCLKGHEEESVTALAKRCHERLTKTRGVVMSLASFHADDGTLTWLGIGNIEGVVVRIAGNGPGHQSLLVRGGVVGARLPVLQAQSIPISPGDLLIVATDGVRAGFGDAVSGREPPDQLARQIMATYGTGTDDALVLVARYTGTAS
jgi:hypothetical protein